MNHGGRRGADFADWVEEPAEKSLLRLHYDGRVDIGKRHEIAALEL